MILLLKVPQQLECSQSETRTLSTPSTSSDVPNVNANISHLVNDDNDKIYDAIKHESSLINSEARLTSESSKINTKSSIDEELKKVTQNPKNDRDEEDSQQIIIILKETIRNSTPEHWNRVRRGDEDETEDGEPSTSNEPSESDASDSNQETAVNDSSQDNDGEIIEDVSNKQSNEDSSSQLDPVETDSTDQEVREERNVKSSKETLEKSEDRNILYPYWYHKPSFDKRYWSSYERESNHNFIKIPIFPGK